jgi:tetratricopeptide (TPR) repeat protein
MNIWELLAIERTKDIRLIKRAYAGKSKIYHPEDDPEGFQRLREAYHQALNEAAISLQAALQPDARQGAALSDPQTQLSDTGVNEGAEEVKSVRDFMAMLEQQCNQDACRNDLDQWQAFLEKEIGWSLDARQALQECVLAFLKENCQLTYEGWILFNDFFCWTGHGEDLTDIFTDDELLRIFGGNGNRQISIRVSDILSNRGDYFADSGSLEEAIAAYDELIALFKECNIPEIKINLAKALCNKAFYSQTLDKRQDAIQAQAGLMELFEAEDGVEIQIAVAAALYDQGVYLGEWERNEAAIAVYNTLIRLFADSDAVEIKRSVANALADKGQCLGQLREYEREMAVCHEMIAAFAACDDLEIRNALVRVLYNQGVSCSERSDYESSIAVYDQLLKFYTEDGDLEYKDYIAKALNNKSVCLGRLGRWEENQAVYEELLVLCKKHDVACRLAVVNGLLKRGVSAVKMGLKNEAASIYKRLITTFADCDEIGVQALVAKAWAKLGDLRRKSNKFNPAIEAYEQCLLISTKYENAGQEKLFATALFNKAVCLDKLGESRSAITAYQELTAMFQNSKDEAVGAIVAKALKALC